MRSEFRAGPVYRAGLIVSGGMCAGFGIAILAALLMHRNEYVRLLPASVPTPPVSACGFAACGLALVGIGLWFPRVTSTLSMVTLAMVLSLAAERVFGLGPRVETLIGANLGVGTWFAIAPNTLAVLLIGSAALLLRHTPRWFGQRLWAIAALGSVAFAIGAVACVGYMTGTPAYAWSRESPMSFASSVCSCALGLGIVMSAYRYSELDENGLPRWFGLTVFVGAMAINLATAVAYLYGSGQTWQREQALGLLPMVVVCGALSGIAARQVRHQFVASRN